MRRAPTSIVILAWNAWEETRRCLDSLRPTLGARDQVVVVDNGSTDATPAELRRYPWVEVVTNERNRGFAGGCNDGAARARHGTIVFLNNDTVLCGHWLDPLLAPLDADPTVAATGPRSNFVSGPQIADGASYLDARGMRAFARAWAAEHRGQTCETTRLVGFCLAVRRWAFEAIGGFDERYGIGGYEDDDLCRRLTDAGHRLLICHESFVHHSGHRTFDANGVDWVEEERRNRQLFVASHGDQPEVGPLVSACLITKDEEANLEACLASIRGLADEVVVYDTGSSDGTVPLARDLGARVIEGYWDDDFSRARNAALEHCRGEWIAWLDADETLECDDIDALRRLLVTTRAEVDGWSVPIHNLTGTGISSQFTHHACRLFRRSRCEWAGRLHEQVAGRGDHRAVRLARLEMAALRHTGYLAEVWRARDKSRRNLRVAAAEVTGTGGWERSYSLVNLARSNLAAGQPAEALDACRRALETVDNPITRRMALRAGAEALLALGELDEALAWVDRLRGHCTNPVQADIAEARVRLARGEHQAALDCFARVAPGSADEDGFTHHPEQYAPQRAEALAALGRHGEAADVLLEALTDHEVLDTHLGTVLEHLGAAGRGPAELVAAIPESHATLFFAQVVQLQPGPADAVLEACVAGGAHALPALAAAATVARRLPTERALVWSARLRAAGQAQACPLVAIADAEGPPVERARAAAVALGAFGDERARGSFAAVVASADPATRQVIRAEAEALCPQLAAAV